MRGNDIVEVNLEKFHKLAGEMMFLEVDVLKLEEIKARIKDVKLQTEICSKYTPNNKEWHIGRIKYFVDHPETIDAIEAYPSGTGISIEDGNHRYMACLILKQKSIKVYLHGIEKILNTLV